MHAGETSLGGPAAILLDASFTVDSKKLAYGPRTIYAGCSSYLGFGVRGHSYSDLMASTVGFVNYGSLRRGFLLVPHYFGMLSGCRQIMAVVERTAWSPMDRLEP